MTVSELKAEAKELGRNWYPSNKECKNGHKWRRYAKNGTCVQCQTPSKYVKVGVENDRRFKANRSKS